MKFIATDSVVEIKSLRSFFQNTDQDNLDFMGEDVHIVFWSYDFRTRELALTEGLEQLYGYKPNELSNFDILTILFRQESKNIEGNFHLSKEKKVPFELKYTAYKKDGSAVWVMTKGTPVLDEEGQIRRYNGVTQDITAKVLQEAELAEATAQYRTLVEKSAQGVYISQDGKYHYVNSQMTEMTGYTQEELLGMNYDQLLDEESIKLVLKRVGAFLSGKDNGSQEITLLKKDGSKITVELRSSVITYKNKPALMGTLLDVTEKKNALEMVNQLAYYDTLTGLPNRNLFYRKINEKLNEARETETKLALLFVDLDQFKIVNDTFGHHAGDELIKETAMEMEELMSTSGFVARYGGDEFVAIVEYEKTQEIERLVQEIITKVPLALSSDIKVVPTIGISLFPEHGKDVESLLRNADIAMYHSKQSENRRQNYSFYNHSISAEILKVNKITNDMQKAMNLNQFHLVYQPKVRLGSSEIEGVEALIRWEHPEYGNISPLDFIPLAEKSGHINQIGDWVLETAIYDMKKVNLPLVLNVNISGRQLLQDSFVEKIELLLKRTGFPAEYLNLEITESVALYDIDKIIEKLKRIKKLGIKISLDDFGTGYSSLSYLTKLPIDCLKVDRSFVNQLETDDSKKAIIKAIIEVAHNLNMEVVAEGVETKKQAELLSSYRCDKGQGYYFSKPLIYKELLNYIDVHD
ncbi:sensor domain-containing protein [Planococcus sp. YIM B11945]|uniref:sensor domain-containing protein n=1 Tax=Planococcus sp. YIM B11945 TaxID=3435410 RepID=UPI003D7CC864